MAAKIIDWKDHANAQFSKALALAITLILFGFLVMPRMESQQSKEESALAEMAEAPPDQREKEEDVQEQEIEISIPVFSEELKTLRNWLNKEPRLCRSLETTRPPPALPCKSMKTKCLPASSLMKMPPFPSVASILPIPPLPKRPVYREQWCWKWRFTKTAGWAMWKFGNRFSPEPVDWMKRRSPPSKPPASSLAR